VSQPVQPGGAIPATGSYEEFLARHPEYESTLGLDELRAREFSRLDDSGQVYLDYTGGSLYGSSQVRSHERFLLDTVLGNPHSTNPTSRAATERIEGCRRQVLEFFNGSPEEYAVIFTANASHALKLVGESYPFEPGDRFLLTFDNHNSVNGIREFHRARGAATTYVPVVPPEMLVDEKTLDGYLATARPGGHNLFAYPAQSNFSGVQHPLEWIERAQTRGWDVLLDAAAYVGTNHLDLSRWRPDYVAVSFYKMFGYPTGIGVLIARRPALRKLHRPWFAGGTITVASVQADSHVLAAGAAAFEDGTPDYANIPAVATGLSFLARAGMERIRCRVGCLASWLIDRLLDLRHPNGRRLVLLYGPRQPDRRGGTVTFNLCDAEGGLLDHELIEEQAGGQGISLRTGCFCNPGAGEVALGLSREELVGCFSQRPDGMTYEEFRTCIDDKGTGAVRVSLGIASNFADVQEFLRFAASFVAPPVTDV